MKNRYAFKMQTKAMREQKQQACIYNFKLQFIEQERSKP